MEGMQREEDDYLHRRKKNYSIATQMRRFIDQEKQVKQLSFSLLFFLQLLNMPSIQAGLL